MNSNNLHHHLILKIRLRVTRRVIINPNNFPLESNQITHHQIFSTAVMLRTALSIGRVLQPYHFTIVLVVSQFQKAAITELMPASSVPVWKKCFQKGACLWWVCIYGLYGNLIQVYVPPVCLPLEGEYGAVVVRIDVKRVRVRRNVAREIESGHIHRSATILPGLWPFNFAWACMCTCTFTVVTAH